MTTRCASNGGDTVCTSESTKGPVYFNSDVPVPDPAEAAKRAAAPHTDPGAISLCPPPHRMTRDGCQ
jgi:hypothetical protein